MAKNHPVFQKVHLDLRKRSTLVSKSHLCLKKCCLTLFIELPSAKSLTNPPFLSPHPLIYTKDQEFNLCSRFTKKPFKPPSLTDTISISTIDHRFLISPPKPTHPLQNHHDIPLNPKRHHTPSFITFCSSPSNLHSLTHTIAKKHVILILRPLSKRLAHTLHH